MRVGVVGGIFHPRHDGRRWLAPERILADGLEAAGVSVTRMDHSTTDVPLPVDVVHVHHVARGLLTALGTWPTIPVVLTPHGLRSGEGPARQAALAALRRIAARRVDAVVALGHSEEQSWRRLGTPEARLHTIPNGIPLIPFGDPLPIDTGRHGLLYVGQLVRGKGVFDLFASLAAIASDQRPTIYLAYQNSMLEGECRDAVRSLGLSPWVQWLGHLHPAELAARYRSVVALVLPSHAEALPSVITEAMLGGARIVATAVGCVEEQVGPMGSVVPAGDREALSRAIASVVTTPWREGEARARHEWAAARYGVAPMIERHLKLYAALLSGMEPHPHRSSIEVVGWRLASRWHAMVAGEARR